MALVKAPWQLTLQLGAVSGQDVLPGDGDDQATAITFTELRSEKLGQPGYTAVSLRGSGVGTQVRQLASKYDDIVIDVGGRDTGNFRTALPVSNPLLIPVQPRSFDLWAVYQIAELVKEARKLNLDLRAALVLNVADPQGRNNDDSAEVLKEIEKLEILDVTIGRRKVFPNAASTGRGSGRADSKRPKGS